MADISITAANVVASGSAQIDRSGVAGVVLTAGQVVYKEAATGFLKLTDTDSATAEVKQAYGITLNGAAVGQPVAVCTGGPVTIGGTLGLGLAYYASNTPGGICAVADVATETVVFLGLSASTSVLNLRIINSGVTVA